MRVLLVLLVVIFLCWPSAALRGFTSFGEDGTAVYDRCRTVSVSGHFRPQGAATYHFSGDCDVSPRALLWNAHGTFNPEDGRTEERIVLNGHSPYGGEIRTSMVCDADPWLEGASCIDLQTHAQGEISSVTHFLIDVQREAAARKSPLTTGFPYNRRHLLAQREADLQAVAAKAEADAQAKAEAAQRRLTQGTGIKAILLPPAIETPMAGQQFPNGTPVPIKLVPPTGSAAAGYLVVLQRKDARGEWVDHGAIAIRATQAQSPSGYTGFGAGAPPTFLSAPGTWRLRAQVSTPKASVWSNWTEFKILDPPAAGSMTNSIAGSPHR